MANEELYEEGRKALIAERDILKRMDNKPMHPYITTQTDHEDALVYMRGHAITEQVGPGSGCNLRAGRYNILTTSGRQRLDLLNRILAE